MIETTDKLWHLEHFNVIQVLSMEERKVLGDMATMEIYQKGDKIYLPASAGKYVCFLKEGNIKISRITNAGDEQVTDVIGPGELFGRYIFDQEDEKQEFAVALKESRICYFNVNDWNKFIFDNPKFYFSVLKVIGARVRRLQTRVEQLQFLNVEDRIKTVIKELADKHANVIEGSKRRELKLNLTHADIAKLSGTSRQSVTAELSELQRKGIISYNRNRVIIEDIDQL